MQRSAKHTQRKVYLINQDVDERIIIKHTLNAQELTLRILFLWLDTGSSDELVKHCNESACFKRAGKFTDSQVITILSRRLVILSARIN
jgi:hypothetical protein